MESFEEAWGIICSYCKTKITDVAYNTWISRIEPIELDFDKNKAVILVPNDFHRQTITRCYLSLLNEAFEAVFGQIFVIEMKIPEEISVKEEQQAAANAEITDISYEYTFDLLGEYILYKVLCEVSEFDDESWQTSVTAEEMIELYSMIACSKTIACMEACEVDELSELSRIEMTELMDEITTTIRNILRAPEYLQILDEYIMWDCDYLLLEDIGVENMLCLLKEPAFVDELGLVESSDQCEQITGSIKGAICEQKK